MLASAGNLETTPFLGSLAGITTLLTLMYAKHLWNLEIFEEHCFPEHLTAVEFPWIIKYMDESNLKNIKSTLGLHSEFL